MRLRDVAERRRGAVRVDVIDLVGVEAGVAQRVGHAAHRAFAVFARRGDVVRVGAHAVARELAVDARAARLARARTPRARACRRPRPARSRRAPTSHGRLAVAGSSLRVDSARAAQKPPTPSGDTVASAPPAIITSASPYSMSRAGFADAMVGGRARRHDREVRALEAVHDRKLARDHVDDRARDEERRNLARAACEHAHRACPRSAAARRCPSRCRRRCARVSSRR